MSTNNYLFKFELEIEGNSREAQRATTKLDHSLQLHWGWALKALQRGYPKLKFIYPKSNRRVREKLG
jgi:hypothetical protein